MKLFVGIDVSSEKLDTCFLDSEDQILLETSLPNNVVGASKIKEHIIQFTENIHYERIIVGMEATSVYSFHPSTFLAEDAELKSLGIEVAVINPKAIHRFKGLFEEDKTDKIDAYRIADFLRFGRFNTSLIKEEKYMALQRLTRSRYQLIGQLTEMKQHFLENLYYECNTLTKEIDTSIFGATMMDLLTDSMTLEDIANMSLEDLAAILQEKGRGRFSNPQKLAKSLSKAIRDSYRLGKVMQDSVDVVLASYAMMIKTIKKQIKELDKAIQQLLEILPESKSLLSIPGVGPVYAAGIIAEIGQIERFENEAKVAKYAGLYWKRKQSGNFESERTTITKTGNHYLRYYLIEAANSVMRNEPVYREYYLKKYHEVPKHQHKRALVLTARKFVRMVDVLLRNHQLYAPERSV
ncbi:Transposase [Anaerobranca californiensis DSM 14826]|jgi:transposase|uniref:Transposase n=1 Tax=Anaerobranca californiensis DSM 14826 TaxID=1120989 RepID=A0A1M6RVU2_9FIRM|nr:IS110 family transposase [Anaerobranca californiensis]SHK36570.1 Transposase [Anaerobranca californiensis DSM 14826]